MFGSVKSCIEAFLGGEACKSGNLRTDGKTLWSYQQPIARWRGEMVEVECRKFSVTTSRHINAVKRAAPGNWVCLMEFPDRRTY